MRIDPVGVSREPTSAEVKFDVVIPTVGRPSLISTLTGLAAGSGPPPQRVIVVDDRRSPGQLDLEDLAPMVAERLVVTRSGGRGPAAARNAGWRLGHAPWVVFVDDDVVPEPGWRTDLTVDLAGLDPSVAGCQGRILVPLPVDRRPTDWERDVAGLARARWATADMAVRRDALELVGGFDERFPRAYREDADLAVRLRRAGYRLAVGDRRVTHPVRPAPWWVSVTRQAGNIDDALMRRLHGRSWRRVAEAGPGRGTHHAGTSILLAGGAALSVGRRSRVVGRVLLLVAGGDLAAFAWARIGPGPRTIAEIARMAVTSALIPPVATLQRLRGWARARRLVPTRLPGAVLFDRDGTLVQDVPYNGDPDRVELMPGAREALDRLRVAGVPTAVVSNQSGVARGLLDAGAVDAVNARVEQLLGPLGTWRVCLHGDDDGCACRKPAPGLVRAAAADLGVAVEDCVVIGDIGSDVAAARRAGARAVLVPTAATRPDEIAAAETLAPDLRRAVDLLIGPLR